MVRRAKKSKKLKSGDNYTSLSVDCECGAAAVMTYDTDTRRFAQGRDESMNLWHKFAFQLIISSTQKRASTDKQSARSDELSWRRKISRRLTKRNEKQRKIEDGNFHFLDFCFLCLLGSREMTFSWPTTIVLQKQSDSISQSFPIQLPLNETREVAESKGKNGGKQHHNRLENAGSCIVLIIIRARELNIVHCPLIVCFSRGASAEIKVVMSQRDEGWVGDYDNTISVE